jgi:hypothetical protein
MMGKTSSGNLVTEKPRAGDISGLNILLASATEGTKGIAIRKALAPVPVMRPV